MDFKILTVGDIVGGPGRRVVMALVPKLKAEGKIQFCVANGENVAGGNGLTAGTLQDLLGAGVDVVTGGDHIWGNKDVLKIPADHPRLLRPYNYPPESRGIGLTVVPASDGTPVAVLHLVGRVFMGPADCPFRRADDAVKELGTRAKILVVDMHGEATSEKLAMGWHLDGRASCIFGSHTHVQTADEQVYPKGTGYITDAGMTGPYRSVLGRHVEPVLAKFLTNMPHRFEVAEEDVRVSGAIFTVDPATGRCSKAERFHWREGEVGG